MIIWYNIKITDLRLNPTSAGSRGNLKNHNRFDVARYTFASMVALEPITSKFIFNIHLDHPYQNRQEEMVDYLKSLFPKNKLEMFWYRCNNLAQWKEMSQLINSIDDDVIWLAGNDDHVYIDSNINLWKKGVELISNDKDYRSAFIYGHYPEAMRAAVLHHGPVELIENGNFLHWQIEGSSVGNVVVKKELLNSFLTKRKNKEKEFFRMDGWEDEWYSNIYFPTKEINRHYDGYWHVNMLPNICPPLDIPPGFFDKNVTIRYGFENRNPDCVNINPLKSLYFVDNNGTDYKCLLEDLPEFWKPYISNIEISDNLDIESFKVARNQHIENLAMCPHNGAHIALPKQWYQTHLK